MVGQPSPFTGVNWFAASARFQPALEFYAVEAWRQRNDAGSAITVRNLSVFHGPWNNHAMFHETDCGSPCAILPPIVDKGMYG